MINYTSLILKLLIDELKDQPLGKACRLGNGFELIGNEEKEIVVYSLIKLLQKGT